MTVIGRDRSAPWRPAQRTMYGGLAKQEAFGKMTNSSMWIMARNEGYQYCEIAAARAHFLISFFLFLILFLFYFYFYFFFFFPPAKNGRLFASCLLPHCTNATLPVESAQIPLLGTTNKILHAPSRRGHDRHGSFRQRTAWRWSVCPA